MTKSAKIENGTVVQVIMGTLPGYVPCGDNVQIGWTYDGETFAAPEPEPESDPIDPNAPYRLYKSVFIERMTPEEAETFEAGLNASDHAKLRLMYNAVEYFLSDDPLFAVLHWELVTEFGEARADALLARD
ncbi:hypothetical protein [Pelagibacterium limicola]|uniref:hypothetical protein n=1 Tax=Pelagibacterium limicola TaxID=2791022 RepID=UPI0018AFF273|nr:hypothetical protein [Pelagibacterium limicola]